MGGVGWNRPSSPSINTDLTVHPYIFPTPAAYRNLLCLKSCMYMVVGRLSYCGDYSCIIIGAVKWINELLKWSVANCLSKFTSELNVISIYLTISLI